MITASEHATQLFVAGLYYWFINEELSAKVCWETAVEVINTVMFVGEA